MKRGGVCSWVRRNVTIGNEQLCLLLQCVTNVLKITFPCLIGVFFTIATLEIDVCGYDNTFLDPYDSYLQVDTQSILSSDKVNTQDGNDSSGEIYRSCSRVVTDGSLFIFIKVVISDPRSRKRKLYLTKSSLLI